MQTRKLTRRLWGSFALSLLLFSLLIGSVFAFLFMDYHQEAHQTEMRHQAETLAAALPAFRDEGFLTQSQPGAETPAPLHDLRHGRMGMGRGHQAGSVPGAGEWCRHNYNMQDSDTPQSSHRAAILHELNQLVQGTVWIVDGESRTISAYGEESRQDITGLPPAVEEVLQEVLSGGTPVADSFSTLFAEPMVTAGAPIKDAKGTVKGAVLVHRHLADLQEAEYMGLKILAAALLLGLLLTAILAAALARRFISPLYSMKDTAEAFRSGHYERRTGVTQDDELGLLAGSLDELGRRLGEAEAERHLLQKQRQEFLAAVSHELRTPLTVIKGTWELLQSGFVKEEGRLRDCRRRIEENLGMLERLVRDLLELTRLQSPGFEIVKEPLDLAEPFGEAIRSARTLADSKGVALAATLPAPLPFAGDYGRLRQLLLIILDNAVKFSPAGAEVKVEYGQSGGSWHLKIIDHGPGIPAADLPHIFDRFKKGGEDNPQGTGLGLAIAREIALRHSLELTCESTEGQGAAFIIRGKA